MAEPRLRPSFRADAAQILQAPALRPRIAPSRTVLAIEPNVMALDVYRMALRPLRCALMHAENGERALQQARRIKPDLIIMDLCLPGLSALDTLEALEAEPGLGAVPVIVVSSLPPTDILPQAAIADFADFFVKPIDAPRLLNAARRFLV
jgi:putative two-component system response regulator